MRLGVCNWAFSGVLRGTRPLRELVAAAREAGFAALEASFLARRDLAMSPDDGADVRDAVSSLATLELHRFHLTDLRPERRQRALELVREMIACAERHRIPAISFSPGPLPAEAAVQDVVGHLGDALAPIVAEAGRRGVHVALENLPGGILADRANMRLALDHLPDVGLCLDIGNTVVNPPVTAWIAELGDRVTKIHLSDGIVGDGAFVPRLPLDGSVPWDEVRRVLGGMRNKAVVYVEAQLPVAGEERQFLAELSRRAREALGV